jgi:hypothetical protein
LAQEPPLRYSGGSVNSRNNGAQHSSHRNPTQRVNNAGRFVRALREPKFNCHLPQEVSAVRFSRGRPAFGHSHCAPLRSPGNLCPGHHNKLPYAREVPTHPAPPH